MNIIINTRPMSETEDKPVLDRLLAGMSSRLLEALINVFLFAVLFLIFKEFGIYTRILLAAILVGVTDLIARTPSRRARRRRCLRRNLMKERAYSTPHQLHISDDYITILMPGITHRLRYDFFSTAYFTILENNDMGIALIGNTLVTLRRSEFQNPAEYRRFIGRLSHWHVRVEGDYAE